LHLNNWLTIHGELLKVRRAPGPGKLTTFRGNYCVTPRGLWFISPQNGQAFKNKVPLAPVCFSERTAFLQFWQDLPPVSRLTAPPALDLPPAKPSFVPAHDCPKRNTEWRRNRSIYRWHGQTMRHSSPCL